MTKKPTKSQVRAQAVAQRQRASEAAAKQRRNRMILWGGLAVIVVIAIVVAVVASGGGDSANATKFETAPVKVSGTPLPVYDSSASSDPAVGKTVPTLTGSSVGDGGAVTIGPDTGDGEPQAIVFVAHWCPHCQAEVPRLVALAKEGVFDGVKVSAVATSTDDRARQLPAVGVAEDRGLAVPGAGRQQDRYRGQGLRAPRVPVLRAGERRRHRGRSGHRRGVATPTSRPTSRR